MIFFKNKLELWCFLMIVLPAAFKACEADADAQGFKPVPPKPASPPPIFVAPRGRPRLLKSLPINDLMEIQPDGKSAGIEKIDVYSNKLMRVTFYVHNQGTLPLLISVNPKETILVDEEGTEYHAKGTERNPNAAYNRTVRPGSKIRFFIDFEEPKVPTMVLGVTIIMNGGYQISESMFPKFEIWLPDFLGPEPPEPVEAPEPPAPPKPPMNRPVAPPVANPVLPPPETETVWPEPVPPRPKQPPVIYEGNASLKAGVAGTVRISFESNPEPGDTNIRAKMFSQGLKQLRTSLSGKSVEDPSSRNGVSFVLTADDGNVLRLSIDGRILTGNDSSDRRYSLRLVEPPRRPGFPSRVITRK